MTRFTEKGPKRKGVQTLASAAESARAASIVAQVLADAQGLAMAGELELPASLAERYNVAKWDCGVSGPIVEVEQWLWNAAADMTHARAEGHEVICRRWELACRHTLALYRGLVDAGQATHELTFLQAAALCAELVPPCFRSVEPSPFGTRAPQLWDGWEFNRLARTLSDVVSPARACFLAALANFTTDFEHRCCFPAEKVAGHAWSLFLDAEEWAVVHRVLKGADFFTNAHGGFRFEPERTPLHPCEVAGHKPDAERVWQRQLAQAPEWARGLMSATYALWSRGERPGHPLPPEAFALMSDFWLIGVPRKSGAKIATAREMVRSGILDANLIAMASGVDRREARRALPKET